MVHDIKVAILQKKCLNEQTEVEVLDVNPSNVLVTDSISNLSN